MAGGKIGYLVKNLKGGGNTLCLLKIWNISDISHRNSFSPMTFTRLVKKQMKQMEYQTLYNHDQIIKYALILYVFILN